ncbi:MAG: cell division protein FtsB [Acidithiobacillales bacterium SM1_46]|nr:MAG: cell division protein FtsB [Acidithiobacillales bacterium SM1_46]
MNQRKLLILGLGAILVLLQYPLWFGSGGFLTLLQLQREIDHQRVENARLRERNQALEAEVADLKQGLAAIEERARSELGMVKKGETFYQVVEPPAAPASPKAAGPKP